MSPKRVGFVEAVKLYFYNYSNFSGRSTESEFGWIILFNMLASIPFEIIEVPIERGILKGGIKRKYITK